MGIQSKEIVQLFTLHDRLVDKFCKLVDLALLLFEVTKPAGSLYTANLSADVCLQIFNLLFVS